MGLIPSKAIERVQFYETKETGWASVATQIGTTSAAVTDLTTKTAAARAAYDAHQAARSAAQTAAQAWHQAAVAMSIAGASVIEQIRAKAKVSGDSIYTLANIPAPNPPAPVGKPGTPTALTVELKADGSMVLKWKCVNPAGAAGTIYHVYRQNDGAGEFKFLGGSGPKEFTDFTVPSGLEKVVYKIQAVRSTLIGDANEFTVKFGVGGGGTLTASVEPGPKLAA